MIIPAPLKEGDTVAVLSPASPAKEKELRNAEQSLELLGLKGRFFPTCRLVHGYLSGEDDQRAKDLHDAFQDDEIQGIFCLRGGYGCGRILPRLDFDMIRRHPKIFLGYSDISVLHHAFQQRCDFMTIHGSMPSINWNRSDPFTVENLKRCLFSFPEGPAPLPEGEPLVPLTAGSAKGRITGGNLCLVVSTLGSPFEIDTRGKILYLEDIGEKPYAIDRMMTALALAGKFRDAAGIILGPFIDCEETEEKTPALTLQDVFREVIVPWHKPTLMNFRSGHIYPQFAFPMGAMTTLDADKAQISFSREQS